VISGVALEGQQAAASARRVKTKPVRMPWRRFADAWLPPSSPLS